MHIQKSLIESHNALPLSAVRSAYLRPVSCLNNETHTVTLETPSSVSSATFTTCFELIRDNMRDMYKRSEIGWSAAKKKKEMKHPAMRFLLLRIRPGVKKLESRGEGEGEEGEGRGEQDWEDEDTEEVEAGKVAGFLSFMVTEEEGEEVIYCYELHLAPGSRGLGLGRHLMAVMEDFGRAVGLGKAMLTCFSENKDGVRFYNRNGYETDETSPEPKCLRNGQVRESNYYILSKAL
ncbi:N alpha-acetyl-transferase [Maublancomyces gigas]|uniref:N-alpha-acetyltransferase 40 n=1 Tax=Discina gigas TaxID=1032678 RepID=A0ABR3GX30_9PEZI